ncbi:DUF6318 family protein [Nesterenkonia populi]
MLTASTSALTFLLLTACGGEAETSEASSAEPDADTSEAPQRDSGAEEEDEDSAPIPASSDGPAQNWPEPEIPEEIYEETEGGAEAALYYWWEALDYSRATGDTELLADVSSEECLACDRQIERVSHLFDEQEGWWVSEPIEVRDSFTRLDDEHRASSVFILREGEFDVYLDGQYDGSSGESRGEVTWRALHVFRDGAWEVDELYVLNPDQLKDSEDEA